MRALSVYQRVPVSCESPQVCRVLPLKPSILPTSAKQALDLRIEERTHPGRRVPFLVHLPKCGWRVLGPYEDSGNKPCTQVLLVRGQLIAAGHDLDNVISINSRHVQPTQLIGRVGMNRCTCSVQRHFPVASR